MDWNEFSSTSQGAAQGAGAGAAGGPWAALAGGIAGGLLSFLGGEEKAARLRRQAIEISRRMSLAQAQQIGMAQVAGASSGVDYSSPSLQRYLTDMSDEFRRQREWAVKSIREQGDDASSAATWGLFTDASKSLFRFGQANNWWRSMPQQPQTAGSPTVYNSPEL